ncbi:MAG: phage tail protein [Yoonia sp.]|nr:phage tail protein [Yoonia sp.]
MRGYVVNDVTTARAALQPLMLTYGFDAIERNGMLVFENRDGKADHVVTDAELALDPSRAAPVTLMRAASAEVSGRVQIGYVDAEADYEAGVSEAVQPEKEPMALLVPKCPWP